MCYQLTIGYNHVDGHKTDIQLSLDYGMCLDDGFRDKILTVCRLPPLEGGCTKSPSTQVGVLS